MKKKTLTTLLLALCLSAQLNFCSADNNYDEEITLPIGTNFDLEMEEVTRYEYDGQYVKAITVNNKEQFILQKAGDTIITVIMDDKGVKTELRVLVHIVSEQQYNDPNAAAKPAAKPAAGTPATPGTPATSGTPAANATPGTSTTVTTPGAISVPANTANPNNKATNPSTPAAAATKPAATAQQPKANSKSEAPAATAQTSPTPAAKAPAEAAKATATAPVKAPVTTTPAAQPAQVAAVPAKPAAIVTSQTIARPTAKPQNNTEAVKYKADQYAFDVLDLVNAEREKYSLRPLSMAKDLQGEAVMRARELTSRFSHTRPDGSKFFTAMSDPGSVNGENIAAGQSTPAAVVKAWMNSSVHRETILSPAYTELGVGYYETTSANYPCYWIQLFRG